MAKLSAVMLAGALLAGAACAGGEKIGGTGGATPTGGVVGAGGVVATGGQTGGTGGEVLDAATGGASPDANGGATATGGSGGAHDASAPDAVADVAHDSPASTCTTSGTELCEDFESGALDPKIWGQHASGGASIVVDGAHTRNGSAFALHVKLKAGGQQTAQITDAVTFPAKDNTFYTRAWIYFDPDLPADQMGGFHMAYLLATGNNDLGFVEAGLGSAGDKQWLGYSEYYGDGPDVHAHGPTFTEFGPRSDTRVVPKTWTCLELMQGGDATTTHRRVWVDGVELPEQKSDFSDRKPPTFSLVSIGVLQYHPTPTLADVWIDDVRVSHARIGCGATAP
ncbi:MAG TPA: hypothetical protein VHJ20_05375 [Polyangia bacterium]|nr:hypothetical protein [Polyangia bacterium]